MKKSLLVVVGMLFASSATFAQTVASTVVPASGATVTAVCKDGTTYSGTTMKGACHGHHGVNKNAGATAASAPASDTLATSERVPSSATATASAPKVSTTAAPGGGAGKVWVNTRSKAYHCQGDKYYGKTKAGEYMSEADAKSQGYHADHGKACE